MINGDEKNLFICLKFFFRFTSFPPKTHFLLPIKQEDIFGNGTCTTHTACLHALHILHAFIVIIPQVSASSVDFIKKEVSSG